jgi:hypothetical protein
MYDNNNEDNDYDFEIVEFPKPDLMNLSLHQLKTIMETEY